MKNKLIHELQNAQNPNKTIKCFQTGGLMKWLRNTNFALWLNKIMRNFWWDFKPSAIDKKLFWRSYWYFINTKTTIEVSYLWFVIFFFPQVCTVGFCGNDATPICACNVWPIYFILKVQWLTRCMFNFKHAYNPAALISNLNSFEFFNKTL